jgi:rod shape determining protein RodA
VFGGAIQPVEFAKLALVLALARFFSKHMGEAGRWRPFMISGVWLLALAGLVMLQPDLGSAVILVVIWLTLLFFFGASKRQWLLLIGGGLALAATAWFAFLSPYQKARVETFLNPAADPLGSGYNVRQSIVAVGSGQVAGRGIGLGSQSQLNFLPEQYTDFIFSAIAEELGLLGSATILVLLGTMLYRLVIIARRSEDDFGTLVALGLAGWLGVQAFINLGGALGLLPLTGLTLPLVSAGGSSLIAVLVSLGVAQSIALRGRQGFG